MVAHPALKQARSLTEAAEAYQGGGGAGALPNPTLQLAAVRGDADETANSLSQTLEIAGQPGLRRKAAEESAAASAASEAALRAKVSKEAALTYYDYWEAFHVARQAASQNELATRLEEVAIGRFQLGEISANEKLRLELLAAQSRSLTVEARGELELAEQALSLLLEEAGPFPLPVLGDALPLAPLLGLAGEAELLEGIDEEVERRPELEQADGKRLRLNGERSWRGALALRICSFPFTAPRLAPRTMSNRGVSWRWWFRSSTGDDWGPSTRARESWSKPGLIASRSSVERCFPRRERRPRATGSPKGESGHG